MAEPAFLSRIKDEVRGKTTPPPTLEGRTPAMEKVVQAGQPAAAAPPPPAPDPMAGIDTSGYALPVVSMGALPAPETPKPEPKTNEAYFKRYHEGVTSSGKALEQDGVTTTMRIASVGVDGKTYLIPTYDPETKQVLPVEQAVKKAMPAIRSGELQPYGSPEEAEADRAAFEPRIVGGPNVRPMVEPDFLKQMKLKVAQDTLGAYEAMGSSMHDSMTNKPASGQAPGGGAGILGQTGGAEASILDKTSRQQLQQDAIGAGKFAGRVAVEAGAAYVGGGVGKEAVKQAGSQLVKKAVPVVGRAVGTALGALKAQSFDPVEDPYGNAAMAAGFSVFGDGLVGAYGATREAFRLKPSGVPGHRAARKILGPGNLPSPGRLSTNRGVDLAENVVENSIVGGEGVAKRNERAILRARTVLRDYVEKFTKGATRQEVDRLVWDITDNRMASFKASAEALYGQVDGAAEHGVDVQSLIELRNKLVTEYQKREPGPGIEKLIRAVDAALEVPENMRGIKANVMVSSQPGPPTYDYTMVPDWRAPPAQSAAPVQGQWTAPSTDPFPTGGGGTPSGPPSYPELAAATQMNPTVPGTPGPVQVPQAGRPMRSGTGSPGNELLGEQWAQGAPAEPRVGTRHRGWVDTPPSARGEIEFRRAASLRSDLLSAQRAAEDVFPGQMEGAAKLLGGATDRAIAASAATLKNPQAFEFWRLANQFWKDGADAFGEQVMKALANSKPDEVFDLVMQGNHPQQVARFRKLVLGGTGAAEDTAPEIRKAAERTLRDPAAHPVAKELAQRRLDGLQAGEEAWETFQGRLMMKVMEGADTGAGISVPGAKGTRTVVGSTALDRWSALGDDMLKEAFPKASKRRLYERLLRTLEITQADTGYAGGKLGAQLLQFGSLVNFVMSFNVKNSFNAGMVIISPKVLGKLLNNETFINAVIDGTRAKAGSPEALRYFTQISLIAAREGARVIGSDGKVYDPDAPSESKRKFQQTVGGAYRRGGP